MAIFRRSLLVSLAGVVAALAGGGPAQAQQPEVTGLDVAVRVEDPNAPVVVLTNRAATPCQVATTPLGTVILHRVEQDGAPIEPIFFDAAFDDGLDRVIAGRLRSLAHGDSVELRIAVLPVGPTGRALETVAWSATAGAVGALYPVKPDRPLRLDAGYAVPGPTADGAPLCSTGMAARSASAAGPAWLRWGLIGGGLLLALVLLAVLVLRSRRRRAARAAATVLIMLAALAAADGRASPAHANIAVDDSLGGAWASCSATLHGPGGDPAGILPTLEASGVTVHIVPANGDETHEGAISNTDIFVLWDPNDRHQYFGSGGNADPCTSLYHEFYHAWEDARGGQDHSPCVTSAGPSGLPVNEVIASRAQNQLRRLLKLPERDHYGTTPLPEGECLPPDRQPRDQNEKCSDGGCADSNGDPHLATFDGWRFDFQAVGEFVGTRDTSGGFEVQVRQSPAGASRIVAVNTAVAMDVAGDRVQVGLDRRGVILHIGGKTRPLEPVTLPAGGSVTPDGGRTVAVRWPDGSAATVTAIGGWGLHLTVDVVRDRAGRLEGLLGNYDGDPTNDIRPAGGRPMEKPAFDQLYPSYADSWRVTPASSLFSYEPGTSTETYTDRTFPDRQARIEDLPDRTGADLLCRRFGVTEPVALAACVLDVGLTGQPDFAVALRDTQGFLGGFGIDGTETVLRVDRPGEPAMLTFAGTAGSIIFVDVRLATLPDQCGVLEVRDPSGRPLTSGCIIAGRGYVDRTVLPSTGEYTLALQPQADVTGTAWVAVVTVADQVGSMAPGDQVMVTIGQPGAEARLTFDGSAGQIIFVDVPSTTLPDTCSPLELRDPAGRLLTSGCVIGGRGYVDRTVLPVAGRYTVLVDPADRDTGRASVRLVSATDQAGTMTVNGPEITATITEPGGQARFTFDGVAGQTVSVEVLSSSLPDQCSPLELRRPDGKLLASGCVVDGLGGISPVTLPTTGRYTVVIDPTTRTSGVTRLALRS